MNKLFLLLEVKFENLPALFIFNEKYNYIACLFQDYASYEDFYMKINDENLTSFVFKWNRPQLLCRIFHKSEELCS